MTTVSPYLNLERRSQQRAKEDALRHRSFGVPRSVYLPRSEFGNRTICDVEKAAPSQKPRYPLDMRVRAELRREWRTAKRMLTEAGRTLTPRGWSFIGGVIVITIVTALFR